LKSIFLPAVNVDLCWFRKVWPLAGWWKPKESLKTSSEKKQPVQALATLHESASLRAVTGTLLRPGGFRLTERGISFCEFSPSARIVDVGCGTGASVAYLREKSQFSLLGLDISEDLLRENGLAGEIPLALARAEELPVFSGVCDGILCECVLSLLPEPQHALSEYARVLRPGGYLIMSDLYDRCPDNTEATCSGKSNSPLRNRSALTSLMMAAGFELLVWEDHTKYLKELAAQLILSQEFLPDFCVFYAVCGLYQFQIKDDLKAARIEAAKRTAEYVEQPKTSQRREGLDMELELGAGSSSVRRTSPGPGYFLLVAQKK
jgi:arsenite methyltransferase